MSPAPDPHSQSSKSASSPQSRTKDQANLAPEPSSPAEPMTDQPNSLLATPPIRKTAQDAVPDAAPDTATTADQAESDAETVDPVTSPATPVETVDTVDPDTRDADSVNAPVGSSQAEAATEISHRDSTSDQPSTDAEVADIEVADIEAATDPLATVSTPEPSESPQESSAAKEAVPAEDAAVTASPSATPRHQPIPPASEPMQYRAIGLVRGKYMPSEEQFTRGFILTEDEVLIDSVLLGRVMSLVKKHIDLEQSHLWVVYPRTRERDLELHMQIVGVWEPEKLNRTTSLDLDDEPDETLDDDAEPSAEPEAELLTTENGNGSESAAEDLNDCYFSVRGEVVYQAEEEQRLLVKIRRAPKPGETEGKVFKVALKGALTGKALGYFWDLQVQRESNELVVTEATQIGMVPPQKRSAGGRGRPPRRGSGGPPRRSGPGADGPPRKRWTGSREDERPARTGGERPERTERPSTSAPSTPRQPVSKPVKRHSKDEES